MIDRSSSNAQLTLDYVSDLPLKSGGGGSYAVNWHAFHELSRCFTIRYAGPVVPQPPRIATAISKFKRHILKRPGQFTYFSEATLSKNAKAVAAKVGANTDGVVFRSAARWSRVHVNIPYFVYLDAVFHTFFHNTFDPRDFVRDDLNRIFEEEARFLEGATAVFFESHWGMRLAREAYSLKGSHYLAIGRGGVIDPPEQDTWDSQTHRLVTIAMDFDQKGGPIVLDAYRILKERFPSLAWHIIGGQPTGDWQQLDGITYEGVVDTDTPAGRRRLNDILGNAFLLLHPTREDTSPLVITEAAYFGCPAISTNAFAIPELVTHGVTGLLINSVSSEEIVSAVSSLIDNEERYRDMRRNARNVALSKSQWKSVGLQMCNRIAAALNE
jgi:glycosyltransferase involved in cell wall biosynthesis